MERNGPLPLKNPFAVQLYSGRRFPPLSAQLEIIARCGFTHVETYGPLNDDPEHTRRQLETFGLSAVSAHSDLDAIASDPGKVAGAARALKIDTIVAPYLAPERRPRDRAGWAALGAFLAEQKRQLAEEGLRLVWHNHDFEFAPLAEGGVGLEYILGEDLDWEADLAWAHRSGEDPSAWIQRYRGRIPLIHVKDIAPPGENTVEDGWADVGAGALDWSALWAECVAAGAETMIAEHDNPSDFTRFARASSAAMRGFARVS